MNEIHWLERAVRVHVLSLTPEPALRMILVWRDHESGESCITEAAHIYN